MKVDRQREPSSCLRLRGSHSRGPLRQHMLCPGGATAHAAAAQAARLPALGTQGAATAAGLIMPGASSQVTLTSRHAWY